MARWQIMTLLSMKPFQYRHSLWLKCLSSYETIRPPQVDINLVKIKDPIIPRAVGRIFQEIYVNALLEHWLFASQSHHQLKLSMAFHGGIGVTNSWQLPRNTVSSDARPKIRKPSGNEWWRNAECKINFGSYPFHPICHTRYYTFLIHRIPLGYINA